MRSPKAFVLEVSMQVAFALGFAARSRRFVPWTCALGLLAGASRGRAQGYVLWEFDGTGASHEVGFSTARAGDVNGDGLDDVVVGAPYGGPGQAFVLSGANGTALFPSVGTTPGGAFGYAVAGAGDVNGDGTPDWIVGAIAQGTGGQAIVYSGANAAILHTFNASAAGESFGSAVAGAGDLNGDGRSDLLVGARAASPGGMAGAGRTRVYSGLDGSVLHTFEGTAPLERLGESVAGPGDVDGDGIPDLFVGAGGATPNGFPSAGRASLYSGANAAPLLVFEGLLPGDELGRAVAGAGDVNGDGIPDLLLGIPGADPGGLSNAGMAAAFSGAGGFPIFPFSGIAAGDALGHSVAGATDLNGDGKSDLIVGSPFASPGGSAFAGEIRAFSGATGALLCALAGAAPFDQFGNSVAPAGDANGDGFGDFVVGAPFADPAGVANAGRATVFSIVGVPAGSSVSGSGCPGSGGVVPVARTTGGPPALGNGAFTLTLSKAKAGTPAVLIGGVSSQSWLGIPLPLPLGGLGLPACSLLVSADLFLYTATNAGGFSFVLAPIPPNPFLSGGVFHLQWYVVDPGPLPLPGAMTEALHLLLL